MKMFFVLLSVVILGEASAQDDIYINRKISPYLIGSKNGIDGEKQQLFFVATTDNEKFNQFLTEKKLFQNIIARYGTSNLFVLKLNRHLIDSVFIPSSLVRFIDIVRTPKEETVLDGFDLSTNKINGVHDQFKSINGSGITVSVKENRPDSNDIDLKGRLHFPSLASSNITSHATIMSTIIAGAGNSYYTGKGVAWGADISSSNFAGLLPDTDADYKKYSISVQNHSYGTGIENYYGADAAAYDASTITNPSLLHVFSSGNLGDMSSITGIYSGIPRYANLTGSFKMAKNIITVGSIDSFYNVPTLGSKGPAYDGRVRPELVAFGQDGSSGAAALVSGTAALLQQAYKEGNSDRLPQAPLIKSILINSADDVAAKGIDFQSGFGSLNAIKAMETLVNTRYFSGTVSQGQLQTFKLNLPPNIHQVKVTLCWNDPPAVANAGKSLVNDLDLRIIDQSTGGFWRPWVLNGFPHPDSLSQLPVRKRDSLNNIEHITIDNPSPGNYTLEVAGYSVSSGSQPFYISYQLDTINQFKWQYPTANDQIEGGNTSTLRWSSTFNILKGKLYYSSDLGNNWKLIAENIDLDKNYFQWTAPDIAGKVIFRMVINNQPFFSNTSIVSSRLITEVGFNCPDSFLIYWNKVPAVSSYTIYQLGNRYLEPLQNITDTSIILRKSINTSVHYAIATNIEDKAGIKSYTFNYNTQGIGCYIKSFLVDLANSNSANVQLEVGTIYDIREIIIEKSSRNGFIPVHIVPDIGVLRFSFTDNNLVTGGNTYRIRINLTNGRTSFSKSETIFYLPGKNYLVFPNPAKSSFQIVSKDPDNAEMILFTATGQEVLTRKLISSLQTIQVPNLKRGLYFVIILQKNKKVYQGSLVIQ